MPRKYGKVPLASELDFSIIHGDAATSMRLARADAFVVARLVVTKEFSTLVCRIRGSNKYYVASTVETQEDAAVKSFTAGKAWPIFRGSEKTPNREPFAPIIAMWALEMLLHGFGALETAHMIRIFQGDTTKGPLFSYIVSRWAPTRMSDSPTQATRGGGLPS
jgi:hypothetical protein